MEILKTFQKVSNAGDVLSTIISKHYFSENIQLASQEPLKENNLIVIGSILEWADEMSHICGGGLLLPSSKLNYKPKEINLIRGPLTEQCLVQQGIKATKLYGDPGILAPKFFPRSQKKQYKIGIIPHYVDANHPWIKQPGNNNILVIDVTAPLELFFKQLQACETILSSSLHGLIFAHAYNIPALWIELSNKVLGNGFKFYDYYLSLGVSPENVTRVKINQTHSPDSLSNLATTGDQKALLNAVKEGIALTKTKLNSLM